jgi:hypothetical protein
MTEQAQADQDIKSDSNVLNNGLVDSDIKSNTNLLNGADTVQDVTIKTAEIDDKDVRTEVTSIAAEEARTGQKINVPTSEELVARATGSYIRNIEELDKLINSKNQTKYKISRHGMNRVLNAILQLPMDDLPVLLQGKEEKLAFGLGQRIIADRYLITHYHIVEEQKKLNKKAEEAKASSEQATNNQEEKGENNG